MRDLTMSSSAGTTPVNPWWRWLWLVVALIALDQATKHVVLARFAPYESLPITGFFNLVLVFNTGAAFSFLADAGGWQKWFFVGLATLISGWLVHMLRAHAGDKLMSLSASLILAGAIGNVVDRLRFDMVVDFIQVHYAGWYFPAFNVADSAISVGVALMLWHQLHTAKASS